ncbi:MAG TPA: ABC transporter permease subunit [Streptosporangiaceae bacterium]|jgi:ABC-type transport system involved in multi-copper enzyme maturation permease subunit
MTVTVTKPSKHAGPSSPVAAGFWSLLHAEWTKFRTVRGWLIGMIVAAILTVFLGVVTSNAQIGCGPTKTGKACLPKIPIGQGGEAVNDTFYFVHRTLAGNGTLTVRVTSLAEKAAVGSGGRSPVPGQGQPGPGLQPEVVPWAKAGIIIKEKDLPGSAYAAMLVTASHGVRMQYDYTGDLAGLPGEVSAAAPRWLRLVRAGQEITGYDSANGTHWTKVGEIKLAGLSSVVQVGLFATSPGYQQIERSFGGASVQGGPSEATAVLDHVTLTGQAGGQRWTGLDLGNGKPGTAAPNPAGPNLPEFDTFRQAGGTFTVTGSGDISPVTSGPGTGYPTATIESNLAGVFAGLIAIVVVATAFFTSEYRRGLLRTTLAANPRRGQVLAAKAAVAGLAAFVIGVIAVVVSIDLGDSKQRNEGLYVLPVSLLTEVRVIVGTAAVLALMAMLAVALGAILRRSAAAITGAVAVIVLPFLLAVIGVFPPGISEWLLRLTPAAGFAIEQSIPQYSQVSTTYSAAGGNYPLPPWAGFAVLCAWTGASLVLALILMRRRDA